MRNRKTLDTWSLLRRKGGANHETIKLLRRERKGAFMHEQNTDWNQVWLDPGEVWSFRTAIETQDQFICNNH